MPPAIEPSYRRTTGLVDVLDRVLDKGLIIAGDIRISLAEVDLLTIRIRLLVCSIDKAEQIGLDWWRHDPNLAVAGRQTALENASLREQIRRLEAQVAALAEENPVKRRTARPRPTGRRVPSGREPGGSNAR
jgi:gas vesicle protein GvpA/GvpJ/GvpM family